MCDKMKDTAAALADFSLPPYSALPEIELYMDQVTGYLNKLLDRVCRSEDGMPLTGSRINNYVKGGYIDRPVQKKYGREQIAMLYMLCCAKQNLSIPEASALLTLCKEAGTEELYEKFRTLQQETVRKTAAELREADGLADKALELLLRSTAERYLAEEIIASLAEPAAEPKEKKPKKEKHK